MHELSDATITPPPDDRLGVLTATAEVVREARSVALDADAAEALAARWADAPWPDDPGFPAMHFTDGTERTANWVLVLDALNFCFWGTPDGMRWRVAAEDGDGDGGTLDGYAALAAALTRAVRDGRPIYDAAYLAALTEGELADILRPAPGNPPIPLFAERLANVREVGRVLLERYGGSFARAVEAAGRDAVSLALLLARDFPSFDDAAMWRGRRVPFLKRAQICVADLREAFGGRGIGALVGPDGLTAFADYKLPQLLRRQGVLRYAPSLAARIDAHDEIAAGSEDEVEIRAATVWAVELLRRGLARRGVVRSASMIDYRIWTESQKRTPDERPYHRTRTIFY